MQYTLTGFQEIQGFRVFSFEGSLTGREKERETYVVRVDLALSRTHGIQLQELPLLCRAVLDQLPEGETRRTFTYSEDEMGVHSTAAAARRLADQRRRNPRRPQPETLGQAWRTPQS